MEEYECIICFDIISNNTKVLECNHLFHKECIDKWSIHSLTNGCPICKKEFEFDNPLYNNWAFRQIEKISLITDKNEKINKLIKLSKNVIKCSYKYEMYHLSLYMTLLEYFYNLKNDIYCCIIIPSPRIKEINENILILKNICTLCL